MLYHSKTIKRNSEPVLPPPPARQAARISLTTGADVLRTGDTASVKFHFLYRPEYLKIGHRIIFREGRTKGIGQIVAIDDKIDPEILGLKKSGGGGGSLAMGENHNNGGAAASTTTAGVATNSNAAQKQSKAAGANSKKAGGK